MVISHVHVDSHYGSSSFLAGYIHADGYVSFNPLYETPDIMEVACRCLSGANLLISSKARARLWPKKLSEKISELFRHRETDGVPGTIKTNARRL